MVGKNCGDLPQITPLDGEVCITKSFRTGNRERNRDRDRDKDKRTERQRQGEWDARM